MSQSRQLRANSGINRHVPAWDRSEFTREDEDIAVASVKGTTTPMEFCHLKPSELAARAREGVSGRLVLRLMEGGRSLPSSCVSSRDARFFWFPVWRSRRGFGVATDLRTKTKNPGLSQTSDPAGSWLYPEIPNATPFRVATFTQTTCSMQSQTRRLSDFFTPRRLSGRREYIFRNAAHVFEKKKTFTRSNARG